MVIIHAGCRCELVIPSRDSYGIINSYKIVSDGTIIGHIQYCPIAKEWALSTGSETIRCSMTLGFIAKVWEILMKQY